VRSSQPEFMLIICFGVVIMAASIIPMGLQETNVKDQAGLNVACMSVPWLLTIGFITSFSVLFAKTWRVNKILLNSNFKRVTVKLRDVLYPFVVLLLVNVALLTAWTLVVPLVWERTSFVSIDEFGRSAESYAVCQPSDGTTNQNLVLVFIILLVACNVASVAFTNYQAFRGRKIKMRINESREIFITMSILTQTALLGIPVFLTVLNFPTARFMIYAFLVASLCLAILVPLYLPKLKAWEKERRDKKNGHRNSHVPSGHSRSREPTIIKSSIRRRSSIKSLRSSIASNGEQGSLEADAEAHYVRTAMRNALAIEENRHRMLEIEGETMSKELKVLPPDSSTATGTTGSSNEADTGKASPSEPADPSEKTLSKAFQATPEGNNLPGASSERGKSDDFMSDECSGSDDGDEDGSGYDSSFDENTLVVDEAETSKAAALNFYLRRINFDIDEDDAHPYNSSQAISSAPFNEVYTSRSFIVDAEHSKRLNEEELLEQIGMVKSTSDGNEKNGPPSAAGILVESLKVERTEHASGADIV
jgi:hypothetical protein